VTKETGEALAILTDRLTRPVVTIMFSGAICWMGLRTIQNISADQFVGIVMMVVGFWFATRGGATTTTSDATTTTTVTPGVTKTETKPTETKP
jgi:hypothetical protein